MQPSSSADAHANKQTPLIPVTTLGRVFLWEPAPGPGRRDGDETVMRPSTQGSRLENQIVFVISVSLIFQRSSRPPGRRSALDELTALTIHHHHRRLRTHQPITTDSFVRIIRSPSASSPPASRTTNHLLSPLPAAPSFPSLNPNSACPEVPSPTLRLSPQKPQQSLVLTVSSLPPGAISPNSLSPSPPPQQDH